MTTWVGITKQPEQTWGYVNQSERVLSKIMEVQLEGVHWEGAF